ncbi:MAG: hypothetical protein ACOX9C_11005 [Kiritimatiellia bacterium]|jgi:rod shape-determining protein MreD
MKMRFWKTALVMAVAVVLATAAQSICPPVPGLYVKAPFLLGVPIYYAMRRGAGSAMVSAVWCGIVDDGLGNLPYGLSFVAFPVVAAFCLTVLRKQLSEGVVSCMVAAAGAGALLQALQGAALAFDGRFSMPPLLFVAARVALAAVVAGIAGGIVATLTRRWDVLCGNAGLADEGDTYSWRST